MQKKIITFVMLLQCMLPKAQDSTYVHSIRQDVNILASDSFEGRGFKCKSKVLATNYVTQRFKQIGLSPYKNNYQHSFYQFGYLEATEGVNIIGMIEGNDPVLKKEYIVVGAHYDHLGWKMKDSVRVIFNGADDNASGVAAMLAVAEKLKKNPPLKRTILFIAFDGEEAGLLGSKWIVKNKLINLNKIKAMFSLDMVGMYSKNDGLDLSGFYMLKDGDTQIRSVADSLQLKIYQLSDKLEQRTDTKPFGEAGIPAFHVFTGEISPYHTPQDDSNLLDYPGIDKVSDLVVAFTKQLSAKDSINISRNPYSQYKKYTESHSRFRIGVMANAGRSYASYRNQFYNGKRIFSYGVGIQSDMKLTTFLRLQPSVGYESAGSKTEYGTLRTHSVVPGMNVLVCTPSGNHNFVYVGGGIYYRHNFMSSLSGNEYTYSDLYKNEETGYKLCYGVSIEKMQLGMVYSSSLTNLRKNKTADDVRSRSLSVNLCIYF